MYKVLFFFLFLFSIISISQCKDNCDGMIKIGDPCTDSCKCCGKTVYCAYHEEGNDRVYTCKDKGALGALHNAFYYLSCI